MKKLNVLAFAAAFILAITLLIPSVTVDTTNTDGNNDGGITILSDLPEIDAF